MSTKDLLKKAHDEFVATTAFIKDGMAGAGRDCYYKVTILDFRVGYGRLIVDVESIHDPRPSEERRFSVNAKLLLIDDDGRLGPNLDEWLEGA